MPRSALHHRPIESDTDRQGKRRTTMTGITPRRRKEASGSAEREMAMKPNLIVRPLRSVCRPRIRRRRLA